LITLSREVTRLKSELRLKEEHLKKTEKERAEARKIIEGKEAAIDKVKREKDELWAIVNTDKYKNLRNIEQDREKAEKGKAELEAQLKDLREESLKASERMKETELKIRDLEI